MILPRNRYDSADLRLIGLLQENSRETMRKLGNRLGMSDVAVYYRIKKLLHNNVIRKFTVLIDPEKLGFSIRATIGIQADPLQLDYVASRIAEEPSFYMVWTVSGAHNIHAEAVFRDTKEMKEVLDKLLHKTRGIQEYHMSIMMKPVKEDYSLSQKIMANIKA
jgi:Lrp/AsnC family transcriptional regulator for asnA, asnC and gidA